MLKKPVFIPVPGFHGPTSWSSLVLKTMYIYIYIKYVLDEIEKVGAAQWKRRGLPHSEKEKKRKMIVWDIYKNYYNWFDNSEIIRSLSCDFFLQRERIFYVNICVLVCDCYFRLLIFVIILFETQQRVERMGKCYNFYWVSLNSHIGIRVKFRGK